MSMLDRVRQAKMELAMKQGTSPEVMAQMAETADRDTARTLDKVGLDIEHYSTAEINHYNAQSIKKIRNDMAGNGLLKVGLALGGSVTERATLGYLSALVEQNWILMRQNELLIDALDRLTTK
jgi:hypothetical protein